MKKGNVIDFILPSDSDEIKRPPETDAAKNDDLETAIKSLIYRLRELGPITQSN